jgi:YD repeat-containing protein
MELFRRISLLVSLLLYFLSAAFAQNENSLPKSFIPPSPNAANLGLYSVIPVDVYTGVPNVDIPIHILRLNELDLGISLSYHAGGVRQSDEASWVGLGWSLNGGGVITRTKRGKDDFSQYGFYKVNPSNRPCNDTYDQEPDLFYFNFAGKVGRFVLDYNAGSNTPKIINLIKNDLLVSLSPSGGWTIVDGAGITYNFETKEQTTDIYDPSIGNTETEVYTSTWYLTKITSPYGEKIDFQYTNTGNKIYKKITTNSTSKLTNWYPSDLFSTFTYFGGIIGTAYLSQVNQVITRSSTNETITDEVLLERIVSEYEMLDFIKGSRVDLTMQNGSMIGKRLDRINLVSTGYNGRTAGTILKSFDLTYDYFNSLSGQPDNISKRLQLTSVQEKSGGLLVPPFNFFYTANQLPDKVNSTNEGGFITNLTDGLLSKLEYPTGGSTNFQYEAHFGGLGARIKKTEQVDYTGTYNIRTYEYLGGKKLGLATPFAPYVADQEITYNRVNVTGLQWGTLYRTITFRSDEYMMGESSGSFLVGYDQVNVFYGVNGQLGKTAHYFKNQASAPVNWVPADVPMENGFLYKQEEFSYLNGGYTLIKRNEADPLVSVVATVQCKRKFTDECNHPYTVKASWVKNMKGTETAYDQNGANPVVTETVFTYGNSNHIYPTTEQITDSKSDVWTIQNKYTHEMSAEVGGVYTTMLQKNMLKLIEKTKVKNGVQISRNKTNYKDWYLDGKLVAPETGEYQQGNNTSEVRLRFHAYNDKGRAIQVSKEDDSRIGYIYGYRETLPIAEVKMSNVNDFSELQSKNYALATSYNIQETQLEAINVINIDHQQGITLTGQIYVTSGSINTFENFHLIIRRSTDNVEVLNRITYFFPETINDFITLPRGTYYVYYSFNANSNGEPPVQLAMNLSVSLKEYLKVSNCFYTSFEEDSWYANSPLTGVNVHWGSFSVPVPANPGKYKLSWWEKPQNSGSWMYKEQFITVTGTPVPSVTIGATGYVIDEVRLHPVDALMTTYTYDPQKGMTSKTDERNRITYFEYDDLGRLIIIRDQDKNILKSFEYKHQEAQ